MAMPGLQVSVVKRVVHAEGTITFECGEHNSAIETFMLNQAIICLMPPFRSSW